jgi:UDP-N-acetylmuramyl pentapeptide phosphotransferase/UDP-N-acetylglucosamine-1-phosphate transferase
LGDGATYGIGFLLGYFLLKIFIRTQNLSPYFVANLLWYPAFENLFSIIRRNVSKKNNYLPDNDHLASINF